MSLLAELVCQFQQAGLALLPEATAVAPFIESSSIGDLTVCTNVHVFTGVDLEWDPAKALANRRKHGIDFADVVEVFSDERAITMGTSPVRGSSMRREYDSSKGKRGAVVRVPSGKTRIMIRIDDDVLEWFKGLVRKACGGSYQALINAALREHMGRSAESLEDTLRRVLKEELSSRLAR